MASNYSNKKVVLTMQQRLDILQDLKTQPVSTIATKYRVHPITIQRIKKNAVSISVFAEKSNQQRKRRRLKRPVYEELEHRLLAWFTQKRRLGDTLSDTILLEKAAEIKENIASCSRSKVSKGWLAKFKKRNNIRMNPLRKYRSKSIEEEDTEFVPVSEEAERKIIIKEEKFHEEVCKEEKSNDSKNPEHHERQEEILDWTEQDGNNMKKLKYLLEKLTHRSATAPTHIQMLVTGLKRYFFIDKNE